MLPEISKCCSMIQQHQAPTNGMYFLKRPTKEIKEHVPNYSQWEYSKQLSTNSILKKYKHFLLRPEIKSKNCTLFRLYTYTQLCGNNQGQQYSAAHGFSYRATEFAVCHGICCLPQKKAELLVFSTFISNSRFTRLLFTFTIYKKIKSSYCKLQK